MSSHCKYCDQCVLDYDHHCWFTNCCIGARNRRSFVYFINSFALLLALYYYAYLVYLWQLTYSLSISDDDSEFLIVEYLTSVALMVVTIKKG